MLFDLDGTIENDLNILLAQEIFIETITNLVRAHSLGKLLLTGTRSLLSALEQSDAFGPEVCAAIASIRGKAYAFGGLKSNLSHMIVVEAGPRAPRVKISEAHQVHFVVGHEWLHERPNTQTPTLLAENSSDASIYESATRGYMYKMGMHGYDLNLQPLSGGGQNVASIICDLARTQTPLLCIIDSDKKCPDGHNGATAMSAAKSWKRTRTTTLSACVTLDARELENLLPEDLVLETCCGSTEHSEAASYLARHGLLSDESDYRFIDLKAGLVGYDWALAPSTESMYLDKVISTTAAPIACARDKPDCKSRSECGCKLIPPLGNRLVANAAEFLRGKKPRTIAEQFSYDGEWGRLAKLVFSWGCASRKQRTQIPVSNRGT